MRDDPAEEARRADRRKQAIHLRVVVGLTWEQVAERLGYSDRSAAYNDVTRQLRRDQQEIRNGLEDLVQQQDIRLDAMRRRAYEILVAPHPLIHNGKIVHDDNGNPLQDSGPALQALLTLLKIEERWSNLHGTDASKKLEIALERRGDLESSIVTEAILAASEALQLPPNQRMKMLEAAAARLDVVDAEVVEGPPE
jgi:hypothetical protein